MMAGVTRKSLSRPSAQVRARPEERCDRPFDKLADYELRVSIEVIHALVVLSPL
jgi:hypothetical protein